MIFSDEIHSDFVFDKNFIPLGRNAEEEDQVISACSPIKSFNMAGLQAALLIAENENLRKRIQGRVIANRLPYSNVFGPIAGEAAYRCGDEYMDSLLAYLRHNFEFVNEFCEKELNTVRMVRAEGTYLAWLDFRGTGLECKEINRRILEQAKIAVDPGEWFGEEGRGFARFSLACGMDMVKEAMGRLKEIFQI